MALSAYQDGLCGIPENPGIFQCEADCHTLAAQIAGLVGPSHPFTRGTVRGIEYCSPSFAEFAQPL